MRRKSRGQSLVEMAMISPFLIMILLMVIDCGRAAWTYSTLAAAAREGARAAITTGNNRPDTNRVIGAVVQNAIGLSLGGATCPNDTPVPAAPTPAANTGVVYVGGGNGNLTPNAPAGQAPSGGAGGCQAIVPSYAGHNPLTVTIRYNFQPLTPFGSQFFNGGIVMTVSSTMSTEY